MPLSTLQGKSMFESYPDTLSNGRLPEPILVRYSGNPIGKPEGATWESVNTLSPGVVFNDGKFHMLYRAQGRAWTSREGDAGDRYVALATAPVK